MTRYALGLGDCLELMAGLPDSSVDLCMTDPPYGTTQCKWDSAIPLGPMWDQLKRVVKPNGAIVLMGMQPFTSALVMSNTAMFKYCWYWNKVLPRGHLNAKKQPLRVIEDLAVFYAKQATYNPQKTTGHGRKRAVTRYAKTSEHPQVYGAEKRHTSYDSTERYPNGLIEFSTGGRRAIQHPTQKPVALMEYMIRTYTNKSEVVLDFTMGSGTTGVAAMNSNRKFIGIELDLGYFETARGRIADALQPNGDT